MKTAIRFNRAARAIALCLTFVPSSCKKWEAVPSSEKAPFTETVSLEREERLLVEGIIAAQNGSVLTAQIERIIHAERALALAIDRCEAGTGTQIDVQHAETVLAESRKAYLDALRSYSLARATGAER